jgi:hypothetical protein
MLCKCTNSTFTLSRSYFHNGLHVSLNYRWNMLIFTRRRIFESWFPSIFFGFPLKERHDLGARGLPWATETTRFKKETTGFITRSQRKEARGPAQHATVQTALPQATTFPLSSPSVPLITGHSSQNIALSWYDMLCPDADLYISVFMSLRSTSHLHHCRKRIPQKRPKLTQLLAATWNSKAPSTPSPPIFSSDCRASPVCFLFHENTRKKRK